MAEVDEILGNSDEEGEVMTAAEVLEKIEEVNCTEENLSVFSKLFFQNKI